MNEGFLQANPTATSITFGHVAQSRQGAIAFNTPQETSELRNEQLDHQSRGAIRAISQVSTTLDDCGPIADVATLEARTKHARQEGLLDKVLVLVHAHVHARPQCLE